MSSDHACSLCQLEMGGGGGVLQLRPRNTGFTAEIAGASLFTGR